MIAPAIANWMTAPTIQPQRILIVKGWTANEIKCGPAYTNPTKMPNVALAPARPDGTKRAQSRVKKNAMTKWPKTSQPKWLIRSVSGRKSVVTSRCALCISVAYQRKPNPKRKTNAAMNAKKNFFQFIISFC